MPIFLPNLYPNFVNVFLNLFLAYLALWNWDSIYGTESHFTGLNVIGTWVFIMSANNWLVYHAISVVENITYLVLGHTYITEDVWLSNFMLFRKLIWRDRWGGAKRLFTAPTKLWKKLNSHVQLKDFTYFLGSEKNATSSTCVDVLPLWRFDSCISSANSSIFNGITEWVMTVNIFKEDCVTTCWKKYYQRQSKFCDWNSSSIIFVYFMQGNTVLVLSTVIYRHKDSIPYILCSAWVIGQTPYRQGYHRLCQWCLDYTWYIPSMVNSAMGKLASSFDSLMAI